MKNIFINIMALLPEWNAFKPGIICGTVGIVLGLITLIVWRKMAKSKLVKANEKIAEGVTEGFKKIEDAVIGGYKKIEKGFIDSYTKIEDKFVDQYLTRDGETVEEAKKRLKSEQ